MICIHLERSEHEQMGFMCKHRLLIMYNVQQMLRNIVYPDIYYKYTLSEM